MHPFWYLLFPSWHRIIWQVSRERNHKMSILPNLGLIWYVLEIVLHCWTLVLELFSIKVQLLRLLEGPKWPNFNFYDYCPILDKSPNFNFCAFWKGWKSLWSKRPKLSGDRKSLLRWVETENHWINVWWKIHKSQVRKSVEFFWKFGGISTLFGTTPHSFISFLRRGGGGVPKKSICAKLAIVDDYSAKFFRRVSLDFLDTVLAPQKVLTHKVWTHKSYRAYI